jgi:hypothetical protein
LFFHVTIAQRDMLADVFHGRPIVRTSASIATYRALYNSGVITGTMQAPRLTAHGKRLAAVVAHHEQLKIEGALKSRLRSRTVVMKDGIVTPAGRAVLNAEADRPDMPMKPERATARRSQPKKKRAR